MQERGASYKFAVAAEQHVQERQYWMEQLFGDWTRTSFPYDFPVGRNAERRMAVETFHFPESLVSEINKLSKGSDIKLHMILVTGLFILSGRYTGSRDMIIGSPILKQETQQDFINTVLVFRNAVEDHSNFKQLLLEVRETIIGANKNQNYPLERLFESPLFDIAVWLDNLYDRHFIDHIPYSIGFGFVRTGDERRMAIRGEVIYNELLYRSDTIQRIINHFFRILEMALRHMDGELFSLDILTDEEKKQLLDEYNRTESNETCDKCLHELFEEQVLHSPDHLALIGSTSVGALREAPLKSCWAVREPPLQKMTLQITYRELNAQADHLARVLCEKGLDSETQPIVAIKMGPSIDMMVAILGILKAGGAYLPIDAEYPQERIDFILNDSCAVLTINDEVIEHFRRGASVYAPGVLTGQFGMGQIHRSAPTEHSPEDRIGQTHGSAPTKKIYQTQRPELTLLAYIIYTSGSTGRPKGVMVEHRQVVSYIHSFWNEFRISSKDIAIQLTTYTFDLFVEEIFPVLLRGGRVVIPSKAEVMDFELLVRLIHREHVTIIDCTPLLLNEFNRRCGDNKGKDKGKNLFSSVHTFISGGDALKGEYVNHLLTHAAVYNTYGPTETTVCATFYKYTEADKTGGLSNVPIGKPIMDYQVTILDPYHQPVPVGVYGEICISGKGVTRGYLNNPELTNNKFITTTTIYSNHSHPTQTKSFCPAFFKKGIASPRWAAGDLLYKSGDLGRWLDGGNIEFGGRVDRQVKIRGYRIETGEIEAQLLTISGVTAGVVAVNESSDGDKYLCAYVVSEQALDAGQIKEALLAQLPEYMVPAFYVRMDQLPVTPSGKIDVKALPDPHTMIITDYVPPDNAVEERIQHIWEEILGAERIGVNDNFFSIGGHSLRGIQVTNALHKAFNVKVPLEEVFKNPTIRGLASYIGKDATAETPHCPIAKAEQKEYYLQSPAQKRLYFLQQMEPLGTGYNMPMPMVFEGKTLSLDTLETLFRQLIARHESLRTSFHMIEGIPVQMVHQTIEFGIEYFDSPTCVEALEAMINAFIRPFDLSEAPLMRIGFIKESDAKHILLMDMHHIVSDGVSMDVMVQEFLLLYQGQSLPELSFQYKEYSEWQNSEIYKESLKSQESYWLKRFDPGEGIPVLELASDYPRPAVQSFEGSTYHFELSIEDARALEALALTSGTTLYMVLLALYNTWLFKMTGQEDMVVGTPTAGRRHADLENIIGMFVNTLALRNFPEAEKTFADFLQDVKQSTLDAFENQDYQFAELVDRVLADRDMSRNPLFDTVFTLDNAVGHTGDSLSESDGLTVKPYELEYTIAKFDLMLGCVNNIDGPMSCTFNYCIRLFKRETIERFGRYFKEVVSSVIQSPDMRLSDIEIIPEEEKKRILEGFNDTQTGYPKEKTIVELFEEQVMQGPDCMAVIGNRLQITYKQLDEYAGRLAVILIEKGVEPDTIVGIKVERSVEMIIGIMGILKAGGGYLSIDPSYPQDRIDYMLADSRAKLFLTEDTGGTEKESGVFPEQVQLGRIHGVDLFRRGAPACAPVQTHGADEDLQEFRRGAPVCAPGQTHGSAPTMNFTKNHSISPSSASPVSSVRNHSSVAYVIYTSGSTGKPKGVLVMDHNVTRLAKNCNYIDIRHSDRMLQVSNYVFDGSVFDIIASMLNGVPLVMVNKNDVLDVNRLANMIKREQITVFLVTTALFNTLVELRIDCLANVRHVLFGGERVSVAHARKALEYMGKGKILHMYGPTETGVYATYYPIDDIENDALTIPIGKVVSHTVIYLLDKNMKPVPFGVQGELYIGGDATARGYLNNPELTNDKFIITNININPHKKITQTKSFWRSRNLFSKRFLAAGGMLYILYKSGDLGYWTSDGNIVFLGRTDHQVKIRGFRVELGEIEALLSGHEKISNAVVTLKQDKNENKNLCAYLVAASGAKELTISEIRDYLATELPDHMIPSYFVYLEKLPVTSRGKIDYSALPDPQESGIRDEARYVAPRTPVEKKLVEIWESVLDRKHIGINENFFQAGGDSIKLIQIVSRMNSAGYKLEMKDLFKYPVIAKLAPFVTRLERVADQSAITGEVPLTPIQNMFFQQANAHHNHLHYFNQAVMFFSKERFDKEILTNVFTKIQAHHDALRMTYQLNTKIIQINQGLDYPLSLEEYHINTAEELQQKMDAIQSGIDIEKGPLMKLGLFHLEDGDRLLIAVHHLVIDAVSWRILFEDIETLYSQYKRGEQPALPPKTDSYKSWAEQLTTFSNSEKFLKEKDYWADLESQAVPELRTDFPVIDNQLKDTKSLSFTLDEEETGRLLTRVNDIFKTEINDVLLTALGIAIRNTFEQNKVLIMLEGHGRESIGDSDMNISRTVGWFTSMVPVLLNISDTENPGRQLKEVKQTLRRVPNKGFGYGILKYLTADENKKGIDFQLEPPISFNYLGQFDADVKQMSAFQMAKESAGNTQSLNGRRDHLIDVNGMIANNRLSMSVSYNETHFKPETAAALIHHFESQLKTLIAYCCSGEGNERTPADFTYKGLSIDDVDRLLKIYPNAEDLYTLTPMQEGMLFHAMAEQASHSYFEQVSYRLQGELDIPLVERSLNELLKRHEILRTVFVYNDIDNDINRPIQVVLKERAIDFYYNIDALEHLHEQEEKERFITEFKEKDKQRSFDLSRDVLMRVSILRVNPGEYEFIWSFHHILMDGWCLGILNNEFFEIYTGYLEHRPCRLPEVQPYRTYIQWLEQQDKQATYRYWEQYLDGFDEQTGIPRNNRGDVSYRNDIFSFDLDKEKTAGLTQLAGRNQVTLNIVIRALWGILLGTYNGKDDVVFGTVVSGRPYHLEGVETMVGLFINTIPVRIRFDADMTFTTLLRQAQDDAMMSESHHYNPLAEIQSRSSLKQNLIDHLFVFENFPISQQIEGSGNESSQDHAVKLTLKNTEIFEQTNYDLNVVLSGSDQLNIRFQFNVNAYDRCYIEQIGNRFVRLMDQIIENEALKIGEFTLLSEDEKHQILVEWNNTQTDYPKDRTIHGLFEEQVEKTPDRMALVEPFTHITYRELNERTNGLACRLSENGVGVNTIVGISMKRSIELIVGILGILKAGGAYLPIDPSYPQERIDYMLTDSGAKLLLATEVTDDTEFFSEQVQLGRIHGVELSRRGAPACAPDAISVRDELGQTHGVELSRKGEPVCAPGQTHGSAPTMNFTKSHSICPPSASSVRSVRNSNLAYILYTSGSTGKPKGVMIQHSNVLRLVIHPNYIEWNPNHRLLLSGNIVFDITTFEIWGPLLNGLNLFLTHSDTFLDSEKLKTFLFQHAINILHLVPELFNRLATSSLGCAIFSGLDYFLIGGDRVNPQYVNLLRNECQKLKILHMYGPTENTTFSSFHPVEHAYHTAIPIGKPLNNTSIYIIDQSDQLVPPGIIGELCVSGDGIALGYLNNPEMTAERFCLRRPGTFLKKGSWTSKNFWFGERGFERVYKTGDLARWLENGDVEFLGRIDKQLKIRGQRIEPGEIENSLLRHPEIKEAAIIIREKGGESYLCAYVISHDPAHDQNSREMKERELRAYLSSFLPDYMVPSYFIFIDHMPLTPNGKIDRNALPSPETMPEETYTAPRDKIETQLAQLWKDVLGSSHAIGIDDNFFQLGGHSLKAAILVSKIHKELNVKFPLVEIFKHPSVRDLSAYIKQTKGSTFSSIEPTEEKEYYALSSAQKRMFVLSQMDATGTTYNMPMILPLQKENGEHVDKNKLENAFNALIARHESLRTSFHTIHDVPVQIIHENVDFEIDYYDVSLTEGTEDTGRMSSLTGHTEDTEHTGAIVKRFIRPFDLSNAPLIRSGLIHLPDQPHDIWMIDLHHIISDGTSHNVLRTDFITLLNGEKPDPLRLQYKDFAEWQNALIQKGELNAQENYWLDLYSDASQLQALELPTDFKRPDVFTFEGDNLSFMLDREDAGKLRDLAFKNGGTLFMTLLSVFNVLFYKYSGQEDIVIGAGISGRTHHDVQNIIGMFVNTLATRNHPRKNTPYETFLKDVVARTFDAFENQDVQFDALVEKLDLERNPSRNPLFDVLIVLQNFEKDFTHNSMVKNNDDDDNNNDDSDNYRNNVSRFDLTFSIYEPGEDIYINIEYYTGVFKRETILRMVSHFQTLTRNICQNPHAQLKDFDIMTEEEKNHILFDFNDTASEYPAHRTIHELFEDQVLRSPDHLALIGLTSVGALREAPIQMSYAELNNQSNALAETLKEKGAVSGDIIAIKMERSIDMIVALLGILKAGCAYLPIEVGYPQERIDYMLKDSNAKLLLATEDTEDTEVFSEQMELGRIHGVDLYRRGAPVCAPDAISVRDELGRIHEVDLYRRGAPVCAPDAISVRDELGQIHGVDLYRRGAPVCAPGQTHGSAPTMNFSKNHSKSPSSVSSVTSVAKNLDLAYIIYTSGSTGKPKGVLTMHHNVTRVVKNTNYIDIKPDDRILQLSNVAFDGSVFDIFGALLNGAALVMMGTGGIEVDHLADRIKREQVTVFFTTTALFNTIVDVRIDSLKHIRNVLFGGERVSVGHTRRALDYMGKGKIIHMYGPTETTVYASYYVIDEIENQAITIPIGKPLSNTSIYILDQSMNPLPVGVQGEIYIGGKGNARGYLNNPELTSDTFLNTPFKITQTKSFCPAFYKKRAAGGILYKSGDLARWLPDGNIEFLGRVDHQVKIRGFRIELGEIESRLIQHDEIHEAIVMAREDKRGDKYLAGYFVSDRVFDSEDIHQLKEYLLLELPEFMVPSYLVQVEHMPLNSSGKIDWRKLPDPRIMGENLNEEHHVGPRNSIEHQLVNIWAELLDCDPERIGIDSDFFALGGQSLKATVLISRIHHVFDTRLTLAQVFTSPTIRSIAGFIHESEKERYESIEKTEEKEYYELSASQKGLYIMYQLDPMSLAYNMPFFFPLEDHADMKKIEDTVQALIDRHEAFRTSFVMVNGEPKQKIHESVDFKLEVAECSREELETPAMFKRSFDLAKAPLIRASVLRCEETFYFFVDMHHIISDGISQEILKHEFMVLYDGKSLPTLHLEYKDYSEWQNRTLSDKGSSIQQQEAFWLNEFSDGVPVLAFPLDFPRPLVKNFAGEMIRFTVNEVLSQKVKVLAVETGSTLNFLLFSIYSILISRYANQDDIVIGSPVFGRKHGDLQNVIGLFVNMLALRTQPVGDITYREFLHQVKEKLVLAMENQEYHFGLLASKLGVQGSAGRNPLFDFVFMLGDMDSGQTGKAKTQIVKHDSPDMDENASDSVDSIPFDMILTAMEAGDTIQMLLRYSSELFKRSTIELFGERYLEILETVISNPGILLNDVVLSHRLLSVEVTNDKNEGDFGF